MGAMLPRQNGGEVFPVGLGRALPSPELQARPSPKATHNGSAGWDGGAPREASVRLGSAKRLALPRRAHCVQTVLAMSSCALPWRCTQWTASMRSFAFTSRSGLEVAARQTRETLSVTCARLGVTGVLSPRERLARRPDREKSTVTAVQTCRRATPSSLLQQSRQRRRGPTLPAEPQKQRRVDGSSHQRTRQAVGARSACWGEEV